MTTATDTFTGQQALEALQPLGFEITRSTDRVFVARGAMKFTLPKGEEYCNPQLNQILHSVIADLKERAINAGRARRDNKVPLMVTYRNPTTDVQTVFAVVEDRHTKWQLQDLDDGHRFEALKIQCRPYEPEPLVTSVPKLTVHEAPPPPPEPEPTPIAPTPVPLSPLLLTGNATDWTALVRLTRRRMEGIKVELEQTLNKARDLQEQYDATVAFLRTMNVEVEEAELPSLQPKRTVLPPTGGHGGGRTPADNTRWIDRLQMAWIDAGKPSGYGYLAKIKAKLQLQGEDMPPDHLLYKLMKDVYARAAS